MEFLLDNEITRNKILLNWTNFYLRQKKKKIRNFGALADGIILADLLEILSQSALPERFLMLSKVKEGENALINIKICLDFIRSKITITLNPLDVFNEKDQPEGRIIRDLIWNLILFYHFGTPKYPVVKLKEILTKYITECGISLERDIINDMLDGTLIFKLAPLIQPNLIIPKEVKTKPISNLQKALKLATRKLYIPEIMSVEDFEPTKGDDIAILIYLGFFINTIKGQFFPQNDAYRRKQSKENHLRSPRTVRIAQFLQSTESLPVFQSDIDILCISESSRILEKSISSQVQRMPLSQIDANKGTAASRSGIPRSKTSKKNEIGLQKSFSESEISSVVFGNTDIKIYNNISPRFNLRGPPRPTSPPICEERTFEETSRSEVPFTPNLKDLSKSDHAPPRPETPRPTEGLYRHLSKSDGPGIPPRPERPPPVIGTPSTTIRKHLRTSSRTENKKRSWSSGNSRGVEIRAGISSKTPMSQKTLSRSDLRRESSRPDVPAISPRDFSSTVEGGKENTSDKRNRSNSAKPLLLDHHRQKIPVIAMKSVFVLQPPVGLVGLGQILKLRVDTVKSLKSPHINLFSVRVSSEGSELGSQFVEVDSVYYVKFCMETTNIIHVEVKFNDKHIQGSPLQIKACSTEVPQILSTSQEAITDETATLPVQVVGITECTTGKVGVVYTKPIPSSWPLDPSEYIIEVNGPPYQKIEITGISSSGIELSFLSNNAGLYYIRLLNQERKFVGNIFVKSKEKEKGSLLKFISEKSSEIPKPSNALIKAQLEDFQFLSTQLKSEESLPDFKLENNCLSEESSLQVRSPSYIPSPPPETESVKPHPLIRLLTPDTTQGERVKRPRPSLSRSPTIEEIPKSKSISSDSVKRAPTFTHIIRKSLQELSFQKPLEIVRIRSPPPQQPAANSTETDKLDKIIDMDADYFQQMASLQQQLHNIRSIRVARKFYCESLSVMADKLSANMSTLFQVTDVDYITLLALSIEKQFRFASEIFKIYRNVILVLLNAEQLEQDEKRAELLESANVLHQHSTTLLKVIRSILEDTQNGADHKNYTVALSETKTLLPKLIRSIQ